MVEINPIERFENYESSAGDSPVAIVNLMKMKQGISLAQFAKELREVVGPTLAEFGAERSIHVL